MELSEEEMKAIKELKHYINITPYWKQEEYTDNEINNYIKIVLNLVEKRRKEIEELKDINKKLEARKYMFNAITGEVKAIPIDNNYISKDKIREKRQEIMSYAYTSAEERHCQDYACDRLQELL